MRVDCEHDTALRHNYAARPWGIRQRVHVVPARALFDSNSEQLFFVDKDFDRLVLSIQDLNMGLPGYENFAAWAGMNTLFGYKDLGRPRIDDIDAMTSWILIDHVRAHTGVFQLTGY